MKKILTVGLILSILLVFSCATTGGGGQSKAGGGYLIEGEWTTQNDAADGGDSQIDFVVADEVIDGKNVKTYTISGILTPTYKNSYLNLIYEPSDADLEALKKAKSISLNYISDGSRYTFYYMTSDVKDWAFHAYNIDAEEPDEIESVEFPLTFLFQPGWGTEVPLRPQNCIGIRFAPHDSLRGKGEFKFKFWDLKVIQ